MDGPTLIEAGTEQEFIAQASAFLTERIRQAIKRHGRCLLGLCGGTTVGSAYAEAGEDASIDWSRVTLFLTDERYVPADDPRSNQFLLRSTILRSAAIPDSQLLFPDTSLPLKSCIKEYAKVLGSVLGKSPPDLLVLGMGTDGHIASLFPPLNEEALGSGYATHTTTHQFEVSDRISTTLAALLPARESLILLRGLEKRVVWTQMMAAAEDVRRWPTHALLAAHPSTVITLW